MARKEPTLKQLARVVRAIDEQDLSTFQMQEVLMSGFITDVCKAAKLDKLGHVDRDAVQRVLKLREGHRESFRLEIGDEPPVEDLIRRGTYDIVVSALEPPLFPPVQPRPRDMIIVELVELDPWGEPFLNPGAEAEALAEAEKAGLERPTYVDALLFGIQHPKAQLKGPPITFLHEPYDRFVLSLTHDGNGQRILGVNCLGRSCRFAFTRKSD